MAVTLEVPFEPVPLRPLPALGRHPRLFRMPATRPRSGFLRAGITHCFLSFFLCYIINQEAESDHEQERLHRAPLRGTFFA